MIIYLSKCGEVDPETLGWDSWKFFPGIPGSEAQNRGKSQEIQVPGPPYGQNSSKSFIPTHSQPQMPHPESVRAGKLTEPASNEAAGAPF